MEEKSNMMADKKKIVIIDDDRITLRMLEKILADRGYEVISAQDGQVGQEIVFREKPDLLICDLLIPQVDGFTLSEKIKRHPEMNETKVILMSAVYKGALYKKEVEESGADAFMVKPLDTETLLKKIESLLR